MLLSTIILVYFFLPRKKAAVGEKSIAVLPFVDMSPQKDQEYFCDGMTEELINRLSNIQALRVPARTSAFFFKGKTADIREIGSKLNVQTVLEGSVQKAGNRLRITAQLINAADGFHLWSEKFDRTLEDVFSIQDEISSAIVEALRLKLSVQEKMKMEVHQISNAKAYEYYLRANYNIWRFKEEFLGQAIRDLQSAIDITGPNPLLYSAMGDAYHQYVNIGAKQEDYIARTKDYARRALALDPDSPAANTLLASLYYYRDLREGIPYLIKALTMNPNETGALLKLIFSYLDIGKLQAAIPLIERYRKTDPLNPDNFLLQGFFNWYDGQFGAALEPARKWYQSDPQNPAKQFFYAQILVYNKSVEKAFAIIDECAQADPNNALCKHGLLLKYGLLKNKKKALHEMTSDFKQTCQRDPDWSYYVAEALALLNEKTEALDWLENAVNRGFINYPFICQKDTFLENIRNEERFKKLMERVKYEWEHFEVPE